MRSVAPETEGDASGATDARGAKVPPAELPEHPIFTWYDPGGAAHLAGSIEEVPVAARTKVVVSRLGGGAAAALAESVTVADYSTSTPTYSTIDLAASGRGTVEGLALLDHDAIYVYSAQWCGFCKKVKAFFHDNQVPFIERDVEKTPGAAQELASKLQAAGVKARGIPVTDIHGELIVGFDRAALEARLQAVGIPLRPLTPDDDPPARAGRTRLKPPVPATDKAHHKGRAAASPPHGARK